MEHYYFLNQKHRFYSSKAFLKAPEISSFWRQKSTMVGGLKSGCRWYWTNWKQWVSRKVNSVLMMCWWSPSASNTGEKKGREREIPHRKPREWEGSHRSNEFWQEHSVESMSSWGHKCNGVYSFPSYYSMFVFISGA